jgi:hypothetical protein
VTALGGARGGSRLLPVLGVDSDGGNVKINKATGWMLLLSLILSVGMLIAPAVAQAKPKVTAHYYLGNHRIKYYSIAGSKYKNANALMKAYAKAAYATNQDALSNYDQDRQDDPEVSPDDYYYKISPKVKYSAGGKLSILYTEDWWGGGPHPDRNYKSFNFYNAKTITLAKAFKSKAKFSSANAIAQKHWRLKWRQEGLYEEPDPSYPGLAGNDWYWTSRGITVIYETYSLGSYADGERRYSVPKSYLKY